MPSSRPRITFSKRGWCNACEWQERKQDIDWEEKWVELLALILKFKKQSGFDCIIPVSGGKDSSMVAWNIREIGMHPLCITFAPPLPTMIGQRNLDNFRLSGFDHILITPDMSVYRKYAKDWFQKFGMPKQPFVTGISTSVIRYAKAFDINLVIWGEQGEVEYSGDASTSYIKKFDRSFLKNIYYEGQDPSEYGPWWQLPDDDTLDKIYNTWYSLFVDWDPEMSAKVAVQKCGMDMLVGGSIGTFTNASQTDDQMQSLHVYLMFLKFGFGRCLSDASIEIRKSRMTREEGVKVGQKLDSIFPLELLSAYLDYFEMSENEFWAVIDKFANRDILFKTGNRERPYELQYRYANYDNFMV